MSKTLSKTGTKAAIARALRKNIRCLNCSTSLIWPKSAYYYCASGSGESPKKKKDEERDALIKAIFNDSNEIYGYRRIRAAHEGAQV